MNKYQTIQGLERKLKENSGAMVTWTNGCFDLLHVNHIRLFRRAASYGDVLVVGINSDASIKKLKGINRPIFCQDDRIEMLEAIKYIDYVVMFNEMSPIELIARLRPDIYVKGGDYTLETINQDERRLVEGYGGKIMLPKIPTNISTSKIIEKLKNGHGHR